jgi:hypothetical protein
MVIYLDSNYKNDAKFIGSKLAASMTNETMTLLYSALLAKFDVS